MTYEQAINALIEVIRTTQTTPQAHRLAKDALVAIQDHVDLMQRQHASRELERLGHIVRHALTPAQYYAAEQAARAEHPEAWAGRLPAQWASNQGGGRMRFGTMFSGGEGVGVGLTAAGLHHAWGIEYDPQIAAVAQANGFDVCVADVRQVDYAALPRVDWLHASPVCTRASVANSGATGSAEDIDTAAAVVRALRAIQPQVFTLENVWQYRTFAAFRLICDTLGRMGYFWTYDHVNAADYGVPQTRRRLVLRASRGLLPMLPEPVRWVGWYEAIEDLLPTLPESKLAPWQLARLPEELRASVLVESRNANQEFGKGYRFAHEPALTGTTDGKPSHAPRAVLIAKTADKFGDGHRQSSEPAQTIGANEHGSKAVLVAGMLNSESTKLTQRDGGDPSFTVTTSPNQKDVRACPGAHVVSMTPRALARFQSVPDSYRLPEKRTLAAKVIGNMVPPLMMQRIAEGMLDVMAVQL